MGFQFQVSSGKMDVDPTETKMGMTLDEIIKEKKNVSAVKKVKRNQGKEGPKKSGSAKKAQMTAEKAKTKTKQDSVQRNAKLAQRRGMKNATIVKMAKEPAKIKSAVQKGSGLKTKPIKASKKVERILKYLLLRDFESLYIINIIHRIQQHLKISLKSSLLLMSLLEYTKWESCNF